MAYDKMFFETIKNGREKSDLKCSRIETCVMYSPCVIRILMSFWLWSVLCGSKLIDETKSIISEMFT